MNYPSITFEGYRWSLIAPFTIDDKLITGFEIENEFSYAGDYRIIHVQLNFHNHLSFRIVDNFGDINLHRVMEDQYRSYYAESPNRYIKKECYHFLYVSDCGTNYLDHLIDDIKSQCRHVNYTDLHDYMYRAAQQDRDCIIDGIPRRLHLSDYSGFSTGSLYFANNATISYDYSLATDYSCGFLTDYGEFSIRSTPERDKIIHSYNYTPEYKKHYLSDESTSLLLGAEIEVDCGGKDEEHAKAVLAIMNGEKWDSEENMFCVHDGSLKNGLEFPTQPGTLAWHKSLPYKEMFEYLDKNGYKAHDTITCGLHIHINRDYFGDQEDNCIGKLMYIIEKFNKEFSVIGRRSCQYSKLLGYNGEKCKDLYAKGSQNKEKYNAINLLHKDTIEIRAFKGTLKYSTFMNTLEFVADLADFVKSHSAEEVEGMQWSDLYATFSDELKQYYDERKALIADTNIPTATTTSTAINVVRAVEIPNFAELWGDYTVEAVSNAIRDRRFRL